METMLIMQERANTMDWADISGTLGVTLSGERLMTNQIDNQLAIIIKNCFNRLREWTVDMAEEGEGETNWESSLHVDTPSCVK